MTFDELLTDLERTWNTSLVFEIPEGDYHECPICYWARCKVFFVEKELDGTLEGLIYTCSKCHSTTNRAL